MIYTFDLQQKLKCSKKEKKAVVKTLLTIYELSLEVRRNGILYLEDSLGVYGTFFDFGITMITNGTDPDVVRKHLEIYIYINVKKGKELLEHLIIMEGLLQIQHGTAPTITMDFLKIFFPLKMRKRIDKKIDSVIDLFVKIKDFGLTPIFCTVISFNFLI